MGWEEQTFGGTNMHPINSTQSMAHLILSWISIFQSTFKDRKSYRCFSGRKEANISKQLLCLFKPAFACYNNQIFPKKYCRICKFDSKMQICAHLYKVNKQHLLACPFHFDTFRYFICITSQYFISRCSRRNRFRFPGRRRRCNWFPYKAADDTSLVVLNGGTRPQKLYLIRNSVISAPTKGLYKTRSREMANKWDRDKSEIRRECFSLSIPAATKREVQPYSFSVQQLKWCDKMFEGRPLSWVDTGCTVNRMLPVGSTAMQISAASD